MFLYLMFLYTSLTIPLDRRTGLVLAIRLEPEIQIERPIFPTNKLFRGTEESISITEPMPDFELIIPDKCKKIGICEEIPNYPHEIVSKVIENLIRRGIMYYVVKEINATIHSVGKTEYKLSLCRSRNVTVYPEAARDIDGHWNLILNSRTKPVQRFSGQVCTGELNASCDNVVEFTCGYEGRCKQKQMLIEMIGLDVKKNEVFKKGHFINSCCTCEAVSSWKYSKC